MSDVEIIDHGWQRIREQLLILGDTELKIGVHDDGRTQNGMTMANLAAIHEFGTREWQITGKQAYFMARHLMGIDPDTDPARFWGTVRSLKKRKLRIPERSFLRAYFDTDLAAIDIARERVLDAVIKGTLTAEEAADQFGFWVVGRLKKRIQGGIDPPNAALTLALRPGAKGGGKPLMNTMQLINAITHKATRGAS